jgi:hypothetical protein
VTDGSGNTTINNQSSSTGWDSIMPSGSSYTGKLTLINIKSTASGNATLMGTINNNGGVRSWTDVRGLISASLTNVNGIRFYRTAGTSTTWSGKFTVIGYV